VKQRTKYLYFSAKKTLKQITSMEQWLGNIETKNETKNTKDKTAVTRIMNAKTPESYDSLVSQSNRALTS